MCTPGSSHPQFICFIDFLSIIRDGADTEDKENVFVKGRSLVQVAAGFEICTWTHSVLSFLISNCEKFWIRDHTSWVTEEFYLSVVILSYRTDHFGSQLHWHLIPFWWGKHWGISISTCDCQRVRKWFFSWCRSRNRVMSKNHPSHLLLSRFYPR